MTTTSRSVTHTRYGRKLLEALQRKPIYQGTVAPGVIEHRREISKRARLARRGKGQRIRAGLTGSARYARLQHLRDVAARANTIHRQKLGGAS